MKTVTSPNKYRGRTAAVRLIVMHTTENDETGSIAENVAAYFSKPSTRASAHVVSDNNSDVRCVADGDTAWAAPGGNSDGLQYELAGRAAQSAAGWRDAYSNALLRRAAKVAADWSIKYAIPVRHLSVAQVRDGRTRGFCGHVDVSRAFRRSSHTDPGANFPWSTFLALVQAEVRARLGSGGGSSAPGGVAKLKVDGHLGPNTITAWQIAEGTEPDGVISKPSSLIAAVQKSINAANAKRHFLSGGPLKVTGRFTTRDRIALVKYLNDLNSRHHFLTGGPLSITKDLTSPRRNMAIQKALNLDLIK